MGLGRGMNNQKEGNGIMALRAGQSYTTDNGKTAVIQGALTKEQNEWHHKDYNKPLKERPHLTLDPAQEL